MKTESGKQARRWWLPVAAIVLVLGGCGGLMTLMHSRAERPAASEFGLGPRVTTAGTYRVTLEPVEPLVKRKLQRVQVRVEDANGAPVEGVQMAIDGGMPQHGHGLPTRPRMTAALGDGLYEVDGVRFNMGDWWEFKVAIRAASGADSVTFNLDL